MRRRRTFILMFSILGIYSLLAAYLAYCQIIRGPRLAAQAADMRSQRIELQELTRGEILDRNLFPLTGSTSSLALYCLTSSSGSEDCRQLASVLAPILGQEAGEIEQELARALEQNSGWVRLAESLDERQQARINSLNHPALLTVPISKRYRNDGFCAHILGYLGGGDNPSGVSGIEKAYDEVLRRDPPRTQLVAVHDARGVAISGLMYKIRQEQQDEKSAVVLTIDRRVQTLAEEAMNRWVKKGAVVVMDIRTKEILALASRPTFDPYRAAANRESDAPLINRALSPYYPGSLFKILTTCAVLEEGLADPGEEFSCSGQYLMPDGFSFSCLRKTGHGRLNLAQAFALSCNPVFIELGSRLGRNRLIDYAGKLHLTDAAIIGYPGQAASEISINPGPRALANASLGQQGVRLSPVQICSLLATIADDGNWSPPRLLSCTVDSRGEKHYPQEAAREQVISPQTARTVQGLLEKVVKEGTGSSAAFPEAQVAGKTGTSQTGALKENEQEILDTWFGGYFPAQEPRWAIVVIVEEGESGARSAAPVFKEMARSMVGSLGTRAN